MDWPADNRIPPWLTALPPMVVCHCPVWLQDGWMEDRSSREAFVMDRWVSCIHWSASSTDQHILPSLLSRSLEAVGYANVNVNVKCKFVWRMRVKTSNALDTLVLRKEKCLQRLSVTVNTTLRIPKFFGQWVSDSRAGPAGNRKRPTAVCAEPVAYSTESWWLLAERSRLFDLIWFDLIINMSLFSAL